MRETRLIKARAGTTRPDSRAAARRGVTAIPEALLQDAPRRLRIASLVMLLLLVLSLALGAALHLLGAQGPPGWIVSLQVLLLLSTVAVYLAARSQRFTPAQIINLGMACEILGSFALALAENLPPHSPHIEFMEHGISRITVWIVLFPLVVPNTPLRALLVAFVSASMGPLTYGLTLRLGNPALPLGDVVKLFSPNYIAVALAAIPVLILSKLGRDAGKAKELGSYRLTRLLGRGGMGEVWEARHRMLARPAAIKLIRPEALGNADSGQPGETASTAMKRFELEAQATATLTSPHTIELYDFGSADDGTFYYVMELLNGIDLETLVERFGPLPVERVVYILEQACCSLADAHLNDMIHRDIKPANMFVCRRGTQHDFVKILDFGLVKAPAGPLEGDARLTVEGTTTGTPAFMPPEMALGTGEATPQTDLYAIGCVAYWLLTGQFVFEGETPMQMIVGHAQAEPVPPSQRTEIAVSPEVDRIILQLLAKSRDDRPRSAGELAELLAAIPLAHPWTGERARHWWQVNLPEYCPHPGGAHPGGSERPAGSPG